MKVFQKKTKAVDNEANMVETRDTKRNRLQRLLSIRKKGEHGDEEPQHISEVDDEERTPSGFSRFFRRKNKEEREEDEDFSGILGFGKGDNAEREGDESKTRFALFKSSSAENLGEDVEAKRSFSFLKDKERVQISAVYRNFGSPDNIEVEKSDTVPQVAGPYDVLIKVQASTVTMNDCLIRRGFDFQILNPVSLPATPGSDVVGYIVETGERVTDFAIGDRVACLVRAGGNARFISVPQDSLVKVPLSLDSAEVASLISTYTTAYQAMRLISGKGPMLSLQGKKVLILGGLDGAGQALIQFCKKAKAEIYATAPKHRHIYLKSVLGVNPLPETDWLSFVTGQLDYVFDGVSDSSVDASKALNHSGQLVRFGYSDLLKQEIGFFGAPMSMRMNKVFSGYTVDIWENFQSDPKTFKDDLQTLLQQLKWNKLKPHIAKRVSLSDVPVAQKKLENGEIRGVIVCFPWRLVRSRKVSSEDS